MTVEAGVDQDRPDLRLEELDLLRPSAAAIAGGWPGLSGVERRDAVAAVATTSSTASADPASAGRA